MSLTVNYVPVVSQGGTLPEIATVLSPIYVNSGLVGLDTVSPGALLDVNGNINCRSTIASDNYGGYTGTTNVILASPSGHSLLLNPAGGNVGIGTSSPQIPLDINGQMRTMYSTTSSPTTGKGIEYQYNSNDTGLIVSYDRTGNVYKPLEIDALPLILNASGGGDIYTNAWADYSGSSTIVGWASISSKSIYTKKIGKTVFVSFYITGTSNSTSTTFTLPYASSSSTPTNGYVSAIQGQDNTSTLTSPGMSFLGASSSTVTLYTSFADAPWTASGTKYVSGQFWYQSA